MNEGEKDRLDKLKTAHEAAHERAMSSDGEAGSEEVWDRFTRGRYALDGRLQKRSGGERRPIQGAQRNKGIEEEVKMMIAMLLLLWKRGSPPGKNAGRARRR
jgi:hypothetical protein